MPSPRPWLPARGAVSPGARAGRPPCLPPPPLAQSSWGGGLCEEDMGELLPEPMRGPQGGQTEGPGTGLEWRDPRRQLGKGQGGGRVWAGVGSAQREPELPVWFCESRGRFVAHPCSRCPSKAPSLGRPWDPGCPLKSAWPAPFGTVRGGVWLPALVSYTTLASALRPHLQAWHSPSRVPAPTLLEAAEKAVCGTGHRGAQAPARPCVSPRNSVLHGKNRARATRQGLTQGPPTEPCHRDSASVAPWPKAQSPRLNLFPSQRQLCSVPAAAVLW